MSNKIDTLSAAVTAAIFKDAVAEPTPVEAAAAAPCS